MSAATDEKATIEKAPAGSPTVGETPPVGNKGGGELGPKKTTKWKEGVTRDTGFHAKERACATGKMGCRCSSKGDMGEEGCDPGGVCYWGSCYGPGYPAPKTYRYTKTARVDYHVIKKLILERLDFQAGMKIVDVGAGRGNYAFEIADLIGADGVIYGTDIDAGAIAQLKEKQAQRAREGRKAGRVVPVFVDGPRVTGLEDVPKGEIDLVLMVNSLIFNKKKWTDADPRYLQEFLKILKPGGRVLYHIDWFSGPGNYSASELKDVFSSAGFSDKVREIPMPGHIPKETFFLVPSTGTKVPLSRGYILVFQKPK